MVEYRRTCLVLDIDETMLHSSENRTLYDAMVEKYANDFDTLTRIRNLSVNMATREGLVRRYSMWTLLRPGWDVLLREARKHFTYLGIYSAGAREYVEACVEIFSEIVDFDFVLSKDDLVNSTKPLSVVLSILPEPVAKEDIVLVDDICENFSANPENGHEILAYSPTTPCSSDDCLYQLASRFSHLSTNSVAKLLKHELPRRFNSLAMPR